jgi:hypothetical protein
MRQGLLASAFFFALGCSSSDSAAPTPTPGPMAGQWTVPITMTGTYLAPHALDWEPVACADTLSLRVADSAGVLTGTFLSSPALLHCDITDPTLPGWTVDIQWDYSITGTRTNNAFTFDTPYCHYIGTLSGTTSAQGTLHCASAPSGAEMTSDGTWTAAK